MCKITLLPCINYYLYCFIIIDIHMLKFKCPNAGCNREYKTKPGIYTHLKYECGVEPKFRCQHCLKSFKRKWSYQSHVLHVHNPLMVSDKGMIFSRETPML